MEEKTVNVFVMDSEKVLHGIRVGLKRQGEQLSKHSGHILVLGMVTLILTIGWQQQANKLNALEKRVQTIESKNNESVE